MKHYYCIRCKSECGQGELAEKVCEFCGGELREITNSPPNDDSLDLGGVWFPENVMQGAAGEFAKAYGSILESPVQFFFISYLTCLGNAISGKVSLNSQIQSQPRIFALLLGESADVRKSTAMKETVRLFGNHISVCKGVGSAEGIGTWVDEENMRTVLYIDEFKQFASKVSIKGSTLLPCTNTLFEDNSYTNVTKHTKIDMQNVHLSVLAASTLKTYENTWSPEFTDIGFNNRLFIVPGLGRRKDFLPPPIPEKTVKAFQKRLGGILGMVDNGHVVSLTDDAMKHMQGWYKGLELSVHTKRVEGYALRMLSLFAVNEETDTVTLDMARNITELMDWQVTMRKRYDPIDADSKVASMEERIRRVLSEDNGEGMLMYLLKKKCHYERAGIWCFNMALTNLKEMGEIFEKHGSKSYRYFLVKDGPK